MGFCATQRARSFQEADESEGVGQPNVGDLAPLALEEVDEEGRYRPQPHRDRVAEAPSPKPKEFALVGLQGVSLPARTEPEALECRSEM